MSHSFNPVTAMNPYYKPYLTLIPVALLAFVAYAVQPRPKPKPTPAQIAAAQAREDERARDEEMMLMARYRKMRAENEKWQKIMMKKAKHFVIENGRKVPSSTDESDRWFKTGKDGLDGIADAGAHDR